jgi:hypothetical protein
MSESIELQVARVVDQEALLEVLAHRGIEAEPLDEGETLGFRIPCDDGGADQACGDLLAQLEDLVAETGLPLVPQRGDGFVFLRPPGD